jgi:flagellar biosynthetic protein FliP
MLRIFILILFSTISTYASSYNDFLDGFNFTGTVGSKSIQILALITVLSLAPSILIMITSFTRIIIVLSFIRNALGLQQTPPNQVLVALALFLTFFVMQPVFIKSYEEGVKPMVNSQINEVEAFEKIFEPFSKFMIKNTREKDLLLFIDIAKIDKTQEKIPLQVVIPSFIISELRRAFEIGFLLFLPFLIIDVLVSSILMAIGMMMMPPVMISLPFKVIFFVLIDGWYILAGSLVKGFAI